MAYIKVNVEFPIRDGTDFAFHAPCDCSSVDGITVVHPHGEQNFVFSDAHGNILTGINNLFVRGSLIKAVLDVTNSVAFLPNADTNGYLERLVGVERLRIDELIAMRASKPNDVLNFTTSDGRVRGNLYSNGTSAVIVLVAENMDTAFGDSTYKTDYVIPPQFKGLRDKVDLSFEEGVLNARIDFTDANNNGYYRIEFHQGAEFYDAVHRAVSTYPLYNIGISELTDIRVGSDGKTVYPIAGDAVRAAHSTAVQALALANDHNADIADLLHDVADLKKNGVPGGGGTGGSSINDNVVSSLSTWSSQKISDELAKLSYEPIAVKSFTASPNKAEVGSTVSVTLNWQFNKTPSSVTVDGSAVTANASGSKTVSGVSATTSWSLVARDSEGASATKSASVYFYNAVYYGAASEPSSYNSDFIKSLSGKEVVGSKLTNFTVNAGAGKYIYYCLPTRYGQCSFSVGGFTGGFSLVGTVSFTNNYNYTENYYVYRSDNASLGNTTVSVS